MNNVHYVNNVQELSPIQAAVAALDRTPNGGVREAIKDVRKRATLLGFLLREPDEVEVATTDDDSDNYIRTDRDTDTDTDRDSNKTEALEASCAALSPNVLFILGFADHLCTAREAACAPHAASDVHGKGGTGLRDGLDSVTLRAKSLLPFEKMGLVTLLVSLCLYLSLRLKLKGLFLYTGGVLFHVECCIR